MSYPTILFPPPPPTHNNLTLVERAHLLRSNAKIGQLLGSTPHVLDEQRWNDGRPSFSSSNFRKQRRRSVDSATFYDQPNGASSSSLSDSTLELAQSRSSCDSSSSSTSSSTHWSASRCDSGKTWRIPFTSSHRPPILRLGKYNGSSSSLSALSYEEDGADIDSSTYSPTSPKFSIPSEAAVRRQKMARLRKRLGEDVPVHLVFPPNTDPNSDDEEMCIVESPMLPSSKPARRERDPASAVKPDPRRSRFVRPDGRARGPELGTHGWESETFAGLTITCRRITTIPEE